MSNIYRTKARQTWVSLLSYDEEERKYHFHINYKDRNWKELNRVVLIFDKKGEFIEAKPFIYDKFTNKTMEETLEDHMLFAKNYKRIAKKAIQLLIKPVEKENMMIDQKETFANDEIVKINFKLEGIEYYYYLDLIEYRDFLICEIKDRVDGCSFSIRNIPSLKGIDTYIQNHPEIRVKYVNELARYKQNK